jgi:hypothetical protein
VPLIPGWKAMRPCEYMPFVSPSVLNRYAASEKKSPPRGVLDAFRLVTNSHRQPNSIQWLHINCWTWRSKMTRARHTCLSPTAGTSTTRHVTKGDSLLWALPEFRWLINVRSLSDRSAEKMTKGTKARHWRFVEGLGRELQVAEDRRNPEEGGRARRRERG